MSRKTKLISMRLSFCKMLKLFLYGKWNEFITNAKECYFVQQFIISSRNSSITKSISNTAQDKKSMLVINWTKMIGLKITAVSMNQLKFTKCLVEFIYNNKSYCMQYWIHNWNKINWWIKFKFWLTLCF